MTLPKWTLILLLVAAIAQLAWIAPQLPDVVATHYDGAGRPNGWMTRGVMVGFQLGLLAILSGAFLGLPVLLGRLSPHLINIPNRDYWLAPERRPATVAALGNWMAAMGCGAVVLLMAVTALIQHAHLTTPPRLSGPALLACVGGFLLYMAGSIVGLYRRFPRPQRT